MRDPLISVGAFQRIYDPSAGEPETWYVNDHTLARDAAGTWRLIGITHRQLDIPPLERFFTAERSITAEAAKALNKELRASAAEAKRAGRPWFDAHAEEQLAHATAPSLTTPQWRKRPFALVADASESVLWRAHVITHDDLHSMFYATGSARGDGDFRIHVATSTDSNEWSRHTANPLFVDDRVGRFDAHAAEVVRDVDGRWYVSHCGWYQGGVYLAPLTRHDGVDDAAAPSPTRSR